ncbi:hypothetical protein ACFLV0_01100 [Chloroflexota bacterium]
MSIDLDELEQAIATMTRRWQLFHVLKRSLTKRGYWKTLPQGDPKKGFLVSRKGKEHGKSE